MTKGDTVYKKGRRCEQKEEFERAANLYRQTIEINPEHAKAHNRLGHTLYQQGKLDTAEDHLHQAIDIDPEYAQAHFNLGLVLEEDFLWDSASYHYRKAIDIEPEHAKAHNNLGNIYHTQGKLDEAAYQLREAIEIKPEYVDAHHNLGNVLYIQGERDASVDHFRKVIDIDPECAEAHYDYGLVLFEKEQWYGAADRFRQAIAINPNHDSAHYNLGIVLEELEKLNEAVGHYRQSIETGMEWTQVHNDIGRVLYQQGKLDTAEDHLRQAIDTDPEYGDAHNNLGLVLENQGKLDGATDHYRKAIDIDPEHADAHDNLRLLLEEQGQYDAASDHYWKKVDINGEYSKKNELIKRFGDDVLLSKILVGKYRVYNNIATKKLRENPVKFAYGLFLLSYLGPLLFEGFAYAQVGSVVVKLPFQGVQESIVSGMIPSFGVEGMSVTERLGFGLAEIFLIPTVKISLAFSIMALHLLTLGFIGCQLFSWTVRYIHGKESKSSNGWLEISHITVGVLYIISFIVYSISHYVNTLGFYFPRTGAITAIIASFILISYPTFDQTGKTSAKVGNYEAQINKDGIMINKFSSDIQTDLIEDVTEYLIEHHNLISSLEPLPYVPGRKRAIIHNSPTYNGNKMNQPRMIAKEYYVEVDLSWERKKREMKRISEACGVECTFRTNE